MNRFDGKVALITGASAGIGAATAVYFASLGCSVALNGRNEERLKEKSEKCRESGLNKDKILVVAGDVSNEEEAKSVIEKTVKYFGRLDILVNNAGISEFGKFENAPLPQVDRIFRTNFRSVFQLTQLAIPHLKRTKGNVVNVSSVSSHLPTQDFVAYGASKAALDHLTKTVARDLGADGVRINAVNPGYVETEILLTMGLTKEEMKASYERGKELSVLNKVGTPEDVAKSIAFLASDDASFITGVTLLVDGGLKLKGANT